MPFCCSPLVLYRHDGVVQFGTSKSTIISSSAAMFCKGLCIINVDCFDCQKSVALSTLSRKEPMPTATAAPQLIRTWGRARWCPWPSDQLRKLFQKNGCKFHKTAKTAIKPIGKWMKMTRLKPLFSEKTYLQIAVHVAKYIKMFCSLCSGQKAVAVLSGNFTGSTFKPPDASHNCRLYR